MRSSDEQDQLNDNRRVQFTAGGETAKQVVVETTAMCQYCNYGFADGWTKLIEYDEVYQQAMAATTEAEYGFHESWDELSEEVY